VRNRPGEEIEIGGRGIVSPGERLGAASVVTVVKLTAPDAISAERSTSAGSAVAPLSSPPIADHRCGQRVADVEIVAVKVPVMRFSCACASSISATAAGLVAPVMTGASLVP